MSYNWDPAGDEQALCINGIDTKARKNLLGVLAANSKHSLCGETAAEHIELRSRAAKGKSCMFGIPWTDTVCINQADDNDSTPYVRIMGDIYSRAEAILIWLGEDRQLL